MSFNSEFSLGLSPQEKSWPSWHQSNSVTQNGWYIRHQGRRRKSTDLVKLHGSWGHDLLYFLLHFPQGYRLPAHVWGQGVTASCLAVVWPWTAPLLEAGLPPQLTAGRWSLMIQTHGAPRHDCGLWHWQFSETIKPRRRVGLACSTLSTILLLPSQNMVSSGHNQRLENGRTSWTTKVWNLLCNYIYNAHLKSNGST